ncbi:pseudouridine synthase [Hymenobacter swuensis]|uniref:Pseudouridine synthase n=1 Tax=Hymenobacter swuensis DY53 TaxID=1227739 RepID=W8FCR5_9BACT|nr:pseudouridine synthase [Hymenobacter swuensis]AHJ99460.1 pseudouridine synthase [Hymenobacter swuensis DY53]
MTEHRHFLLYKPFGYLSQFMSNNAREARKKKFLGDLHDFPAETMAVGRLDEHSEGLLLLTTDGRVSERIRRKDVEKEYYAQVDGVPTDEAIRQLQEGLEIAHRSVLYQTLPARVRRLEQAPDFPARGRKIRDERHGPTSWVSIIVTEGKFRQVRKMTAAAGYPTLRLVRVRVGSIWLTDMQPGEVREMPELMPPDAANEDNEPE